MERRAAFKIAVSDSSGGMFSAFVGDFWCRIGPGNRNGARMQSVVAEIIAKQHVPDAASQGKGVVRHRLLRATPRNLFDLRYF